MHITIIGAGPIGCYLAELLAKKGNKVDVYEEDSVIGNPVQCTGIITKDILDILEIKKEFLVNKLSRCIVNSKNNSLVIDLDEYVIDREKFDQYLAERAKKAGAKIHLKYRYIGNKDTLINLRDSTGRLISFHTDILIGADGPTSSVAKKNFPNFKKRRHYIGIQARVKGNFKQDCYEVFLEKDFDDFFAWVVPESKDIARIGVASKKDVFDKFNILKNKLKIDKKDIIEKQGGLIPIYDKKQHIKNKKNNVFLAGDAALQVKATTGGGLIPGLKAAETLADSIQDKKDYRKQLRYLEKKLKLHLKIRKIFDNFSDYEYNKLISDLNDPKTRKILKKYSRDQSVKLITKLLFNRPKLLYHIRKAL